MNHLLHILLLLVFQQPAAPPSTPAEVKASFLKLLDRPRVPPDAKIESSTTDRGFLVERLSFASEKKADGTTERVPTLVVRPSDDSKRRPAVIALHGTGGTKEGMRPWLNELAGRGFVAVAIDGRYHGERSGGGKGTEAYNRAIVGAWRAGPGEPQEHPFYYDTCWDIWRAVDYLQSRADVDPSRIGLVGVSKGGIETWLAGAVDDRIKVAIPAISVQSFRWGLDNDKWQARARTIAAAHDVAAKDLIEPAVNAKVCRTLWDKIIPGMTGPYDCPSMLRLFAGRPLLILNGSEDPNCPIGGARLAFASAEAAYRDAGAPDKLKILVAEGVGHSVTRQQHDAALEWFVRWLAP